MNHSNTALPLIVSITGHRHIVAPSIETLKGKIKASLNYLIEKYPATPIWVHSALADGADRIAAHAVIEMKKEAEHKGLNIRLVAPLPLELDDYKKDFSEPSKQVFDQLLSAVDEYYILDPYLYIDSNGNQITQEDISPARASGADLFTEARNAQYANLGAFLARHCNVLIALWDGKDSVDSPGGTSNVVNLMLEGDMNWGEIDGYKIPPRPGFEKKPMFGGGESGVVFHIPVARETAKGVEKLIPLRDQRHDGNDDWNKYAELSDVNCYFTSNHFDVTDLDNDKQKKESERYIAEVRDEFQETLERIEQFNRDAANIDNTTEPWLPLDNSEPFQAHTSQVKELFSIADTMALQSQTKTNIGFLLFFILITITAFSFEVFDGDWEGIRLGNSSFSLFQSGLDGKLHFVFAVSAILLLLLRWWIGFKQYRDKSFTYRTLSEALRVSYYMSYLRLHHQVAKLFEQNSEMDTAWISHAINVMDMPSWINNHYEEEDFNGINRYKDVKASWIDDQINYFESNTSKLGRYISRGKLGEIFHILAIILILFLIGKTFFIEITDVDLTGTAVLMVLSAAIAQWIEMKGYNEDKDRYALVAKRFRYTSLDITSTLSSDLDSTEKERELKESMTNLARYAFHENISWYIFHQAKNFGLDTSWIRKATSFFISDIK